jgi:voltage-gated potassium channel
MDSKYWPKMLEGRDADDEEAKLAKAKSIERLHAEMAALREEIQELLHQNSEQ